MREELHTVCCECGAKMIESLYEECDACYNKRGAKHKEAEASVSTEEAIKANPQINQPDYYNWHPSGVACVDISEHFPGNIAQAVQYIYRAGRKPGEPAEKDYSKAVWFLLREIQRIKKTPAAKNAN